MLQKIMSSADAAINVGIKLISLAIVLQVVFSDVPFLGGGDVIGSLISIVQQLADNGLVGLLAALLIWRLLDSDVKKELSE